MSNTKTGIERKLLTEKSIQSSILHPERLSYGVLQTSVLRMNSEFNSLANTFHVIAEDGSPVWEVWKNDTLFLPSGKRFDVLVTATGNGSIPLNNTFAEPYGTLNHNIIATVNIQGNQTDVKHADIIPTSLIQGET